MEYYLGIKGMMYWINFKILMQSEGSKKQKNYILNDSNYLTFNKGRHYMTESRSVVLGAGGGKRGLATKGHEGNLGAYRNVYVMITWLSTFV